MALWHALFFVCVGHCQQYDARWAGGYPGGPAPAFGGNKTLFLSDEVTYSVQEPHSLFMEEGVAMITNEEDSLFAYMNGWRFNNAAHLPMLNGDGFNPSSIGSTDDGLRASYSQLIVPWPAHPDSFLLFHNVPDAYWPVSNNVYSSKLYYSVIVQGLDGDTLAGVSSKNNVLLEEPMLRGGLGVVKHANGRDWWLLSHGMMNDEFVLFLLSPSGIDGPFYQAIGDVMEGSTPAAIFSMQGDRLAYGQFVSGLDIYDFDRCTGILSNRRNVNFTEQATFRVGQFSPDGSKIYVPAGIYIYQLQLEPDGDLAAIDTVAFYDGFYDDNPVFATYFVYPMLARDGRIYISTGNSTRYMHVINEPDLPGDACGVVQHGHHRATWSANSIPYRPNYGLGPVVGSVCDSLDLSTGALEWPGDAVLRASPNPTTGTVLLRWPGQPEAGNLEVLDTEGRALLRRRISPWTGEHALDLKAASGMYQCRLVWGSRLLSTRIILMEP
ncbi:MAG: T9SS type A sorting domain-containing protein [Flavobacteriales bacterium]|nr:T9SS type A sorting domain-containing protein [Flavobacteriales bacterium]